MPTQKRKSKTETAQPSPAKALRLLRGRAAVLRQHILKTEDQDLIRRADAVLEAAREAHAQYTLLTKQVTKSLTNIDRKLGTLTQVNKFIYRSAVRRNKK